MRSRLIFTLATTALLLTLSGTAIAAPDGGSGKKDRGGSEPIVDPLPVSCTAATSPGSSKIGCGSSFTLATTTRVTIKQTVEADFTGRLTSYVDGAPVATATYAAGGLVAGPRWPRWNSRH